MIELFRSGNLQVDYVTIPIKGLAAELEGTRVVQLSDFHFDGFHLSTQTLEKAIAVSNSWQPHFVMLTGDFVTDDPQPIYSLARHLENMTSQSGMYAALGNHDLEESHSQRTITEALSRSGITVLWNEVSYPLGKNLAIVGLADYWSKEFHPQYVLPHIPSDIPRLVLCHNPDAAALLKKWRIDLQLSGHTHGGQVVLPKLGPIMSHARRIRLSTPPLIRKLLWHKRNEVVHHWEWSEGLHQVGSNYLYVNRGLGTYLPGRFNCPPEITFITLVSAPIKPNSEQAIVKEVAYAR